MCAFRFRLESVVGLKKRKEDEHKIALACAREELQQKEENLVSLHKKRRDCQDAFGSRMDSRGVGVPEMLIYYAYLEKLTDEIADGAGAVERSREDVEDKRRRLLESSREKKALENLKDRMKARYLLEMRKAEQADMDETASRFHTRKSRMGLSWKEVDES